jgi:hypothetical protein
MEEIKILKGISRQMISSPRTSRINGLKMSIITMPRIKTEVEEEELMEVRIKKDFLES